MLRHTIITKKEDTGDRYSDHRYVELETPDLPEIGKKYFVYEREYVGPNRNQYFHQLKWTNDPTMIGQGFPGNSDHHIRRFHGWRGTTNDTSITALGVRKCLGVTIKDFQKSVRYHLRFGADQVKDRE